MLKKCFISAILVCGPQTVVADTIELKDKASITGKVLAEKRDQIAVDVGYTVLVIPRNQIVKISKPETSEPSPKTVPSPKAAADVETKITTESKAGFYSAPNKPLPQRSVRDLVNQIGEAV